VAGVEKSRERVVEAGIKSGRITKRRVVEKNVTSLGGEGQNISRKNLTGSEIFLAAKLLGTKDREKSRQHAQRGTIRRKQDPSRNTTFIA